jgi:carbonic anhydrase
MTHQESLERLMEGNQRFVDNCLEGKMQNGFRRAELTNGQKPYAIILSCADSRVVPELTFDTGLGELFVIRVAGNIANTSSLASIEYAIVNCGVKLIMVLGHESCGAVTTAIQGGDNGYNLNHLLCQIAPAISASSENPTVNEVVKENAKLTALEVLNRSSIVNKFVDFQGVKVVPAYYNLESGKVDFL